MHTRNQDVCAKESIVDKKQEEKSGKESKKNKKRD